MNKLERNRLKKLHFIKRIKLLAQKYYGFNNTKWFNLIQMHGMQVFRNTGKPCSCWMCRGLRYSKKDRFNKKILLKELKESS